jgi:C-terminal processing protease CtpA/Prc
MKGSQCVVSGADPGSWGYEAGIRVGDRIVAIDGKSTVGTPRDSLRSHLYFAQREELHVSVIDLPNDGGRNISLSRGAKGQKGNP